MKSHCKGWSIDTNPNEMNWSKKWYERVSIPQTYGKAKRSGRPPKLSATDRRHILREARKGKNNQAALSDLNLPIGKTKVREILKEMSTLKFKKIKTALPLTEEHCIQKPANPCLFFGAGIQCCTANALEWSVQYPKWELRKLSPTKAGNCFSIWNLSPFTNNIRLRPCRCNLTCHKVFITAPYECFVFQGINAMWNYLSLAK